MSLTEDIRLLSQVPLFKDMNDDQLRLVAFGAERRQVAAGQELFRERSPAESAFIIARGRFELLMTDRNGEPKVEATVGPGTLLSELALITMVERKFTAVAVEDAEAMKISRSLFHRLLEEYPEVGRVIERRIRDNIASLAKAAAAMSHRFV
ncbi:cyclic nucleotide-binding protein [Neorhizobium sp. R1-B]|jgi:CRP-like cAMP-binding protein|uniref:cyclic nucleotide-binding domain-containing protein n=1 Tax=unclassified Neorhizobium TaxID=2629175 RepID=UPI000DDA768E|nr:MULTISPECIES: cyclic nucleotide-binding domain-containing protein [unclassified Neorhizobium]TCV58181.1 cyclic nucleotide-binding protein [Neorhizobium sp. S3-V5DH]TDX69500.1 cyclic nucleotide-binding protein [Neorhizobium sp. R1-B]